MNVLDLQAEAADAAGLVEDLQVACADIGLDEADLLRVAVDELAADTDCAMTCETLEDFVANLAAMKTKVVAIALAVGRDRKQARLEGNETFASFLSEIDGVLHQLAKELKDL